MPRSVVRYRGSMEYTPICAPMPRANRKIITQKERTRRTGTSIRGLGWSPGKAPTRRKKRRKAAPRRPHSPARSSKVTRQLAQWRTRAASRGATTRLTGGASCCTESARPQSCVRTIAGTVPTEEGWCSPAHRPSTAKQPAIMPKELAKLATISMIPAPNTAMRMEPR